MNRIFNTSADCKPGLHYMVDIEDRLIEMKAMVDRGDYFTVNRARQFGKTTTLKALGRYLKKDYPRSKKQYSCERKCLAGLSMNCSRLHRRIRTI